MGGGLPSLPRSFKQLSGEIGDAVADCIVVAARSSGTLALPGWFSTDSPPRPHAWEVLARGDSGFYVDKTVIGTPRRYHVLYQVDNERDTSVTAYLKWTDVPIEETNEVAAVTEPTIPVGAEGARAS